ncbi:MAG: hypothetical protein HKN47_20590 [Pirellulaceae bacterium]|nr:hypothetical protein [Pirellulaceae bacterium]
MQKLINACCFDVLGEIEDEQVDLIIADIPYFGITDESWDNQWEDMEDYLAWLGRLASECVDGLSLLRLTSDTAM